MIDNSDDLSTILHVTSNHRIAVEFLNFINDIELESCPFLYAITRPDGRYEIRTNDKAHKMVDALQIMAGSFESGYLAGRRPNLTWTEN